MMADAPDPLTHIALLPSSGMGHLAPFLRLAATLDARGCTVTLITILPTVSSTESRHLSLFFSTYPNIRRMDFHLLPFDPTTAPSSDPFFLQSESIRHSSHILPPLLSSASPPLSALITDIFLTSTVVPAVAELPFCNYIFFSSSASMLGFCAYFPLAVDGGDHLQIPGMPPVPNSSIPPLLLRPTNLFKAQFVENGLALVRADCILVNTFRALEPDALTALNAAPTIPPVIAVGPLEACRFERATGNQQLVLSWLDAQPAGSVVYVSFGSRTALSGDQIKQLADGLEKSGCRFLWVVKGKIVDKEDGGGLGELVGDGFLERVRERGLVVKDWVEQWKILEHSAVGGFVSHCGWNSVTEAAWHGVPVLAWGQSGDQRINAGVVEKSGLGIWERRWSWGGDEAEVVMGFEIGVKVRELMTDAGVRERAARVGEEARRAVAVGGSSVNALMGVIQTLKLRAV